MNPKTTALALALLTLSPIAGAAAAIPPAATPAKPTAVSNLAKADAAFVAYDQPVIAITNIVLIDGSGSPSRRDMTVVIRDGRIAAVGPSAQLKPPAEATLIDGSGKTLTPGFVMMHEHLFYPNSSGGYGDYPEAFSRLYLASGETVIRTAGSLNPYADLAVARAIRAGRQVGPDMDVSSPYLEGQPQAVPRMPRIVKPEDAVKVVDYWAHEGVTSYKVYEHISRDELKATIDAAHAHGMKVTGHICSVTYREAIERGIDNLEHTFQEPSDFVADKKPDVCPPWPIRLAALDKLDPEGPEIGALIHDLIAHKVALTSTLAITEQLAAGRPQASPEALAPLSPNLQHAYVSAWTGFHASPFAKLVADFMPKLNAMERRFVREGGLLMAGSDPTGFGGVVPGSSAGRQLRLLVEGGFTLPQAVKIMSLNGATYLGRSAELGSVEVGKRADLVLFDMDATASLDAFDHPLTVFKTGVGYDPMAIKRAYAGKVGED